MLSVSLNKRCPVVSLLEVWLLVETQISLVIIDRRKEGSVLFNDALNTFSNGYMVKDHSDS